MAESAVPEGFDGFMERVEVNGILYDRIPWGAEFPWHSGCPACGEESGRPHAASDHVPLKWCHLDRSILNAMTIMP